MIRISKHYPIPSDSRARYPWDEMEIGDSFALPKAKIGTLKSAAVYQNKRSNNKYVVRLSGDKARCWRVK